MLRTVAVVSLLGAVLVPVADADWTSFRGDSRNSATVPNSIYALYEDVWWNNKTVGGAEIQASPVLKDGILIIADLGSTAPCPANAGSSSTTTAKPGSTILGQVRALDAESGKQVWCHQMTGPVIATPAISGQTVYVVDTKGVLRSLNLKTGEKIKEVTGVGAAQGSITFHEGRFFFGNEAGELKAFADDLTPEWTFKISDSKYGQTYNATTDRCSNPFAAQPIRSAPAVFDGKVFFGTNNHYLFAVDLLGTGDDRTTIEWVYKTAGRILGAPTINIQSSTVARVVVGSDDGKVYSFDPTPSGTGGNKCYGMYHSPAFTPYEVPNIVDSASGEVQISHVESSPATSSGRIYFGANNGHVYAINANTGALIWENKTTGSEIEAIKSSPVVANNLVVVGSENKHVYWLDATTGNVLKSFATEGPVINAPAIDGVRAFVAASDGTVYMFGPKIPTRADLIVQSITATDDGVKITLKNQGDAASTATNVRILKGGEFLANVDVPAIEPGQSASVEHEVELDPEATTAIKAIVDPDATVVESNDANNELQKNVSPPAPPEDEDEGGDGGGGLKIPAPGLVPLLALLGLAVLAMRRRR